MAFIGFAVPHQTARILSEIEVPGVREDIAHFHITLLVLDDGVPIGDIAKAMEAAYGVASKVRPFTVRTTKVSCFPENAGGVPIICPVESEELEEIWEDLKAAFEKAGVGFSDKFPVYKPHVTLAWAEEPIEDISIPVVEWGAHELVLWGGDTGDRRILIHLPFSLKNRVASRYRVAKSEAGLRERLVQRFVTRN